MKIRRAFAFTVALAGAGLLWTFSMPPAPVWAQVQAANTEDILYMKDGRVLHGKVISETKTQVVFEYRDAASNIKAQLSFALADISRVERNVAVTDASASAEPDEPSDAGASSNSTWTPLPRTGETPIGVVRVPEDRTDVPSLMVVPLRGQLGTDVRRDRFKEVIEEVKRLKPTVVVFKMDCGDTSELMHPTGYERPKSRNPTSEWGIMDFEELRDLLHDLRDGLREFPQVMWIHDSDGISATFAMGWDRIYMTPKARLGAKISVLQRSGALSWADPDIRAKMVAAWLGIARGFLEKGGYALELANAMIDQRATLSGSWHGRSVKWFLDDTGEYLVDASNKHAATFNAKSAEDMCISQGTAETLDDLALLLGYREYRLLEGRQYQLTEGYIEEWRRRFLETQKWYDDYERFMGWAGNADAVKYLGQAKASIDRIIRAMDQYKAIEIRWGMDFGVSKHDLIVISEKLAEQIRGLKRTAGGAGRPAGGGGGGSVRPGGR